MHEAVSPSRLLGTSGIIDNSFYDLKLGLRKRPNYAMPYLDLFDCSQQTELRQQNTPCLLHRMLLQEHNSINSTMKESTT